jgi:ABC-type dipeptide/oligopeptide/nickel transport system permease component
MKFSQFFLRRLLYSILVLLGLSIVIFFISRILPGDPARLTLGPFAPQEQVDQLRERMGMDKPLPLQYLNYIKGLFYGDLGLSFQTRRNVALDIAHYLPATIELITVAIFWVFIIGVPLGVLSGRYKDGWLDNIGRVIAFIGVSVPPFVVGLFGQIIFSYVLGILPTTGRLSLLTPKPPNFSGLYLLDSLIAGEFGIFMDAFKHLLLPSFAVAMTGIGQITRITRSGVIEVLNKDYIESARAFGIPGRYITFKYMLKPSFIAPMTILGLSFASQLGNAFLVETVFAWPGMAKYGIHAIMRKDFNAIMGVVLIIGLAFVLVNFLVDILAGYIDPRIRIQEESVEE